MKSTDSINADAPSEALASQRGAHSLLLRLAEGVATAGFLLYAVFAPHSIAGAEMSLAIVGAGWFLRTILMRRTGFRPTPLDLPIWLFFGWTILSAFFSQESLISLLKIQSTCVILLFYLAQAVITRRTVILVVALMIASGVAGSLWSVLETIRGRGVVIERMTDDSPFRERLGAGDAIWRVGSRRVNSVAEIDEEIRKGRAGERLGISFISEGENGEWPDLMVTEEMKARPAPSGIESFGPTHRFRASGWTRHYETFSETLQILTQLALGLALAYLSARRTRRQAIISIIACSLLATGIILTAMRTVLFATVIGASLIAWRSLRGRSRLVLLVVIALVFCTGTLIVWRTRASQSLTLQDASSTLRLRVARTGLARIPLHPFFGHGMDAVKKHWEEWGFPGREMIHLHSTPLQIAFDRGLPALIFWLWMMAAFWRLATRAERSARQEQDAGRHGILLGATGALAGFFASSLVNYNFGDGEVALVFFWLMGVVVALSVRERANVR
ncbi:MAG TPA: O-antigen ligase family protein [Pyrinomonadaceae bacterium]